MDKLRDALLDLIKSALLGFDSMLEYATEVLQDGLNAWSIIESFTNVLKPFCLVVIAICLLIELAQVAAKVDVIKWEHGLKICVKDIFI